MLRAGLIAAALLAACAEAPQPEPPPRPPPPIDLADGPARFEVAQRTTVDVPRSGGQVRIHVGDITEDQVRVRISDANAGTLAGTVSLGDGGEMAFELDGHEYRLLVVKVHDRFISGDRAELEVQSAEEPRPPTGKERIEILLEAVETSGLTFIRNGSEHDAKKATDHLKGKWESAGDRIQTAEQFIDLVATKSSTTGKPYQLRLADGSLVATADWLRERLQEQP